MRQLGLASFGSLFLAVVCADQVTKWLIQKSFVLHESRTVIANVFDLVYYTNNGAAFSMLAGQPALWRQVFFISITIIALVIIGFAYRSYSKESGWLSLALALIAGGAVGNLIDRICYGHVIDFIAVYLGSYQWPAFNVADSAITVGVTIFVVVSVFLDKHKKRNEIEQ